MTITLRKRLPEWIAFALIAFSMGQSHAGYVGESFLSVPGIDGGWPGSQYKGWVKFESREWTDTPLCLARQGDMKDPRAVLTCDEQFYIPRESRLFFSGPWAPRDGGGEVTVALDKKSPAYEPMMELCERGKTIEKLVYADSSELSRRIGEAGPRPESIPEYLEYALKQVEMRCPKVAAAPEQAFMLRFADIDWLNLDVARVDENNRIAIEAAPAPTLYRPVSGSSKTFLLTWITPTGMHSEDECPQLNKEPGLDDYFALWPKSELAKGREELNKRGGLVVLGPAISMRAPHRYNVCAIPGTVPDPGHVLAQSPVARGFNLDQAEGPHTNYVGEQGERGIDNQVYTVEGCVPGFRPNGNIPKVSNEMMRTGSISVLVNVSGIDNDQQDDDVVVSILYSNDRMEKYADGSGIQPNYTFRASTNPEFSQYFTQFPGRIVDGVIETDSIDVMTFQDGGQNAFKLFDARLRIEMLEGDRIKALLGGYHDWRRRFANWSRARLLEPTMRFQCPGMYHAYKRAADGLPDPVTGENHGISVAYDMDGVRAFIPEKQLNALLIPREKVAAKVASSQVAK